jgi:hypothetical protein
MGYRQWLAATAYAAALLLMPTSAQAQGTWLRTGCLAAAGATAAAPSNPNKDATVVPSGLPSATTSTTSSATPRTVPACKAAPAWGSTGSEYVQAALAQADAASVMPPVANTAISGTATSTAPLKSAVETDSADSEALLVSFTQKNQLAATLLGYLDARAPLAGYRWNGPTATDAALAALAAPTANATGATGATGSAASNSASSSAITAGWQLMSNPGLGGSLGNSGRSSSWWLQGVYAGAAETQTLSLAPAEAGAQLPFLANTCPQVEGKAVGSSADRCTVAVNSVPEPGTWALVVLAMGLMWALRRNTSRRSV